MEPTVAELLNRLFDEHRRPDGREHTYQDIARATNGELSPTYLAKLRSGHIANPGRHHLLLICKFFRVPASYFFPELEVFEPSAEEPSPEEQLRAAFRSMGVPADVQTHLVGVAQAFKHHREEEP